MSINKKDDHTGDGYNQDEYGQEPSFDYEVNGDEDFHEDDPDEGSKTRMELYDWLQCIVAAVISGIFVFVFVGRTIGVDGPSMMGTLHDRDRVIMSNLFYTPSNGDIVVFQSTSATFGGTPLVKRVIATQGQSVDIDFETGDVFVDGEIIYEPYIFERTHNNRAGFQGPVWVPEGYVFVMGDNRNSSTDSRDREVGMVDTRYILGQVVFIAIPGADAHNPRDWSRIGVA
ncbi:MAG: signal peptidase I, partial [Oscillospiraceae bacterium]|nr:signal peptidase I [Oscillospiraceae bacterium]